MTDDKRHTDGDHLDPAALSAWEAMEPPHGFAERVVAAREATPAAESSSSSGRPRRRLGLVAVVALAAAAALALFWRGGGGDPAAEGELTARGRQTVDLGGRGVAVAEDRSELAWRVSSRGAAVIEQSKGSVFYRVEEGGPFSVLTPAGRVTVTGTCFRVEVHSMKPKKQALVGAALGAAVVVSVYEGSVLFANDEGKMEARAGESITAAEGSAPALGEESAASAARGEGAAGEVGGDLPAAPAQSASRDELLARDRVQRQEIADLRGKVRDLEEGLSGRAGAPDSGDGSGEPWHNPSEEALQQFAKECKVRFDVPAQLFESQPERMSAEQAEELGLSDEQRSAMDAAFAALHEEVRRKMRALYIEATGDVRAADSLSPSAMRSEIADKALPGEAARIRRRIARERAGLISPPADLSNTSPLERYFRLHASLGDEAERRIADVIGRSRARELRAKNGGWNNRMSMAGCPDERR